MILKPLLLTSLFLASLTASAEDLCMESSRCIVSMSSSPLVTEPSSYVKGSFYVSKNVLFKISKTCISYGNRFEVSESAVQEVATKILKFKSADYPNAPVYDVAIAAASSNLEDILRSEVTDLYPKCN